MIGLHAGCCFVLFSALHAWNSGGNWYSRPGELVSPRRECQKLAQGFASSTRPGEWLRFERQVSSLRRDSLAWARDREIFQNPLWGSPKREPVAWARQFLSSGRGLLAWARLPQQVALTLFSLWFDGWFVWFICFLFSKPKACEYIWLFDSYELKLGWLVENLHENWMFWDKGGGCGMKHEFGVW